METIPAEHAREALERIRDGEDPDVVWDSMPHETIEDLDRDEPELDGLQRDDLDRQEERQL